MSWQRAFLRGIGLVLLLAAAPKLRHPVSFKVALESYELFPLWSIPFLIYSVPALEVFLGLKLLFAPGRKSISASAVLFGLFAAVLAWAWMRGDLLICGCFGRVDLFLHKLPQGLLLHILLNALAALGLWRCRLLGQSVQDD